MSPHRKKWLLVVAVATAVATAMNLPAGAGPEPAGVDVAEGQPRDTTPVTNHIYAVTAPTSADADRLVSAGFDLLEDRDGDTLFVAGDASVGDRLKAEGFQSEISQTMTPMWENPGGLIGNPDSARAVVADTFYGGYHTSMGHLNHLQRVGAAKPDLTKVYNVGKTFTGKYDIRVMCITKMGPGDCEQRTDSKKPKFFLMTQTHAREIAAGEMAYKLIDKLTTEYGKDAEVTALLDSAEVWVLPIANPDGLDIVAQGGRPSMQRKNRNPTSGNCQGDQIGVDLNRNNDTHFGGASTSKNPCSDIYLGPGPNSEVENKALQGIWQKLFKKNREGNGAAPPNASGYMLSIHTVAGMNLVPWEYANTPAPNDRSLKAIGGVMKSYNGYRTGQASQILYAASGGHDDWIYDKLGVASATIELGGSGECGGQNFHPHYRCVDQYWSANSKVLMYLGKIAKEPYKAGLGPNVREVAVNGTTVTAEIDAHTYELFNVGREGTGNDVTVAEYSFDPSFGTVFPMEIAHQGVTAKASATAVTKGRAAGKQLVYVRAKDREGNYGPTTAAWITVG